ncbi:C40 family peptidase [Solimicrobium silvestre]|uniref:NlpC/P60 family n=1 Tax=Solimicrobium silvestre TaxID=2099400 RepID=A0A2S9GXR5_9BURK|nr:NlpC/P60 family protein [Solimicrobium silvestre]PRC92503.1 NlpC/P60 family [Solimicrobium silvestre]
MYKPSPLQLKKLGNKSYMVRIEPNLWIPATFARAMQLTDILRFPEDGYSNFSPSRKDSLRQSQIESNEVVRVLGHHEQHILIMKSDKVLGWVLQNEVEISPEIKAFDPVTSMKLSTGEFFDLWSGTPYVWGGITRIGIDCSGLAQCYFRDVLDRCIPKNTFDQRRSGTSKDLANISKHDLIFCTRIGGRGTHHVGIYVDGDVWHAHRDHGVIRQSLSDFLVDYQVLEVVNRIKD